MKKPIKLRILLVFLILGVLAGIAQVLQVGLIGLKIGFTEGFFAGIFSFVTYGLPPILITILLIGTTRFVWIKSKKAFVWTYTTAIANVIVVTARLITQLFKHVENPSVYTTSSLTSPIVMFVFLVVFWTTAITYLHIAKDTKEIAFKN